MMFWLIARPSPTPLAGFFGGEKWLEDLRQDVGRNARPVIAHFNLDRILAPRSTCS